MFASRWHEVQFERWKELGGLMIAYFYDTM